METLVQVDQISSRGLKSSRSLKGSRSLRFLFLIFYFLFLILYYLYINRSSLHQRREDFLSKPTTMDTKEYKFEFQVYDSADELPMEDASLLNEAREATKNAYAPYSNFHVGAVAKLANGETVTGTNQENASYPVGICAERSLLATAAALFPNVAIAVMAISYDNLNGDSSKPISPCGMCRQSLNEYENRMKSPIRLILGGLEGKIYIIERSSQLLPFNFSSTDLK
ncbi:MAG: cytidine deaminase [Ferruginibacter sp.]